MDFDPDAYLAAQSFDPDKYLKSDTPNLDEAKRIGGKIKNQALGAAEAGVNLFGNMVGYPLALVGGGLSGVNDVLGGRYKNGVDTRPNDPTAGDVFDKISDAGAHLGTKYFKDVGINSEEGEDYTNNMNDFINRYLIALGPTHIPAVEGALPGAALGIQSAKDRLGKRFGSSAADRIPVGQALDNIKSPELPVNDALFRAKMNAADEAQVARLEATLNKRNESQPTINIDSEGNTVTSKQLDNINTYHQELANQRRTADAQAALEARQRAMEQDVAKQTGLDMNAAERARQDQAPVTSPEMMRDMEARNAADIQSSIDKTQDLNNRGQQMGIVEDYGNNDPMSRMPNMRVDENGIPIRADLSMEAQNLQNPLQRNLWGDELPGKTGDEGIPLTQAIDKMPPGVERQMALGMLNGKGGTQRGVVDFKDIADHIGKTLSRVTEAAAPIRLDRAAPISKDDFARGIPGIGNALDGIIVRPEFDINKAIDSSKDLPDMFKDGVIAKGIQSGPGLTAEKYKHPVIKQISALFQYQDKKTDFAQTKLVKPVERQLTNLNSLDRKDISEVLRKEMTEGKRYTDEQLAQAGVSAKGIEAYKALRKQLDNAYDVQANALRKQGIEPPTREEAYLASLRDGPWHVTVTGQDGRPWHIAVNSKREAIKAQEWLQNNLGGEKLKISLDNRESNRVQGVPRDVLGAYQDIIKHLDEGSDASLVVKEAIRKAQEEAGYNYRGQSNRFKDKYNFRGFEGDMPWLNEKENNNRLLQSQIDYLNNSYNWAYMSDILGDVKNIVGDERFTREQPNAASYVKDVVRQQIGLGDHLFRQAENKLGQALGLSGKSVRETFGKANSITSLTLLGASAGYALQAPLSVLNALALHVREGSYKPTAVIKGVHDGLAVVLNGLIHSTGITEKGLPLTALGKEAYKYAEDNGIISKHMFGDLDAITKNRTLTKFVQEPLSWTITAPERMQRSLTFFGFVHGLESTGKYKNMYDLFQRAEELTEIAATNFRKSERPLLVEQAGSLGTAAFKFKAPILNYYNQLHMLTKEIIDAKGPAAKARATANWAALLGTTAILGGLVSLPAVSEFDSAWEGTKSLLSHLSPQTYAKVRDVGVKSTIRENAGQAWANGLVEHATGAAMQQRFGTDVLDLQNPLGSVPVASTVSNAVQGVGDLAQGNPSQAAWRLAPPAIKGNLEVSNDSFKAAGQGLYRKPSDTEDPASYLKRNDSDESYRRWGLRSKEEARQLDQRFNESKTAKRDETATKSTVNNVVDAALAGDEFKVASYAKTFYQINPDGNLGSMIQNKLEASSLSPAVREMVQAKTVRAIERAKKALEAEKR